MTLYQKFIWRFRHTLVVVLDCFLIFWFCIKENQVYYTWITYTPVLLVSIQLLFSHCVKYAKIRVSLSVFSRMWTESYRHLPVFGQNLRFCPNTGKYEYDLVHIRENTDRRKSVFRHISRSVLLSIFSHKLDLLDLFKARFVCVKFHPCRICLTDFRERWAFLHFPLPSVSSP